MDITSTTMYIWLYTVLLVYLVIGNNPKNMTPRIPHAIAKQLCNILDISDFHKYASI